MNTTEPCETMRRNPQDDRETYAVPKLQFLGSLRGLTKSQGLGNTPDFTFVMNDPSPAP
jgi:hypothetical protein